ncbi:MAG: type II toxin-antitoxin system VapC family toxin [Gemmatimonadota bacterium]
MKLVVADASALAEYLLRTERGEEIRPVVEAEAHDLHTPFLCDVELAAVLRRGLLAGRMGDVRAREALTDYLDLPLERHGHPQLVSRALELRENFSAYDAVYVALAEGLGAALLTADRPLARATRRHTGVTVLP